MDNTANYDLDFLFECDTHNAEEAKQGLKQIFPNSLKLIDYYLQFFTDFAHLWGSECSYDKNQRVINDWAKTHNVKGIEILRYLNSATLIGKPTKIDKTQQAKSALVTAQSISVRSFLLMRLHRDFLYGLSDLLRFRITPSIGYIRIQSETSGLLKFFAENQTSTIVNEWLSTHTKEEGRSFHNKWHSKIKREIRILGLDGDYDSASGLALHSRIGGIAMGALIGSKDTNPGELRLNFQEIDDINDLFFWFGYYMRFHRKIIEKVELLFPEVSKDKIITEKFTSMLNLEQTLWEESKKNRRSVIDRLHKHSNAPKRLENG